MPSMQGCYECSQTSAWDGCAKHRTASMTPEKAPVTPPRCHEPETVKIAGAPDQQYVCDRAEGHTGKHHGTLPDGSSLTWASPATGEGLDWDRIWRAFSLVFSFVPDKDEQAEVLRHYEAEE